MSTVAVLLEVFRVKDIFHKKKSLMFNLDFTLYAYKTKHSFLSVNV